MASPAWKKLHFIQISFHTFLEEKELKAAVIHVSQTSALWVTESLIVETSCYNLLFSVGGCEGVTVVSVWWCYRQSWIRWIWEKDSKASVWCSGRSEVSIPEVGMTLQQCKQQSRPVFRLSERVVTVTAERGSTACCHRSSGSNTVCITFTHSCYTLMTAALSLLS